MLFKNFLVFNIVYIKDAYSFGPLIRVERDRMEAGGWDKCFKFCFSCVHGEEGGLLPAVKLRQHVGMHGI